MSLCPDECQRLDINALDSNQMCRAVCRIGRDLRSLQAISLFI